MCSSRDIYATSHGTESCPYANKNYLYTLPTESMEIIFTLSGVDFTETFIEPTAEPTPAPTATPTPAPKDVSSLAVSLEDKSETYTGTALTTNVTVYDGDSKLKANVDYTVAYTNNINAGQATVTITGMGKYTGTKSLNFEITKFQLNNSNVSLEYSKTAYDQKEKKPRVIIKNGANIKDYTVSYKNNVAVGTATVTVAGKNNCVGTVTKTFDINLGVLCPMNYVVYGSGKLNLKVLSSAKITWTSTKKKVAKVNSKGVVTYKKPGTTKIKAASANKFVEFSMTVKKAGLTAKSLSIPKGETATLVLNGAQGKVKWKSSKKSVATVSSKGVIKAKKFGKVTITAKDKKKIYKCKVKVIPKPYVVKFAQNQVTGVYGGSIYLRYTENFGYLKDMNSWSANKVSVVSSNSEFKVLTIKNASSSGGTLVIQAPDKLTSTTITVKHNGKAIAKCYVTASNKMSKKDFDMQYAALILFLKQYKNNTYSQLLSYSSGIYNYANLSISYDAMNNEIKFSLSRALKTSMKYSDDYYIDLKFSINPNNPSKVEVQESRMYYSAWGGGVYTPSNKDTVARSSINNSYSGVGSKYIKEMTAFYRSVIKDFSFRNYGFGVEITN